MTNKTSTDLKLESFIPYRLAVLSARISRAIADLYEQEFDISMPEWRVLAALGENGNVSARTVAANSAMDKVAVSRAVKKLIDRGFVERSFSNDDRRRSELLLSKSGRQVYDKIAPLALSYEHKLLEQLSEKEREQLGNLVSKLESAQQSLLPD
jgi:DNA-binding MarR family transcriptional regulator